jgi:histidinol-phosphate aminotransferase
MISERPAELIDRGFDSDFSSDRINQLFQSFGSETDFQELIDRIHEEDNTIDMKRGEFYPEILRCIASMKRALAYAYGIDTKQCHPSFGTNGSIDTIMMAMKLREVNRPPCNEEGGMLAATPTYFRNYNSCASKQMKMVAVPLRAGDWEIDLDRFLDTLKRFRPTVVFLVTPNNPTGLPLQDEDIIQIIEHTPEDVLVVIDRTLVNVKPEIQTASLLQRFRHKQVAILHSLSKYAGMSHLRIGYALYSQVAVAEEIRPLLPLGLGVEGAVKATRLLMAQGPLKPQPRVVENIRQTKEILHEFCARQSVFTCTAFVANYCVMTLPPDVSSPEVTSYLAGRGLYVMGGHEFPEPNPGVLRLHTGGKPEYIEKLIGALNAMV